jgi:flagella basal body P-ring formation protein FlgA
VVVARSNLKRGQPLGEADVITERRDVISLREPLDPTSLSEIGVELNENVAAGQPLLARSVRLRPVVLRGQLIDALMLDGTLQISLKVEVLSDGLPGQTIRVRNPKTKREFYAKVQNDQSVLLN